MSRRRKIVVAAVSVLVLLPASLVLYLSLSDLAAWRDPVASIATKALDRELGIHGDFEVHLGSVTRVRATELTLANTAWGSEAEMATIDWIEAEIELWPLASGSIHLLSVEIDGGRALFESAPEQGSNWVLGTGGGEEPGDPVRLRIDSIRARDVDLVFRSPSTEPEWKLSVAQLDSTGDDNGAHQLSARGRLRGVDISIDGRLTSLESLVNLDTVHHDLSMRLGSNHLSSAGTISDPATLSGLDLHAELSATNPVQLATLFGLAETPVEALTATLTARPDTELTGFTVAVGGTIGNLDAEGTIDSILEPGTIDLGFRLDAPDVRPVALLLGADEFSELPFSASGRLRWQGFPIDVSDLRVTVGDNRITADGRLGSPPRLLETDFRFAGSGPDVAALGVVAGQQLPHGAFELAGRLLRVENGFRIDDVAASVGSTTVAVTGFIGDAPDYDGTDLELDVGGPDLSQYSKLVGVDLPDLPFRIAGRLVPGDDAIALHGIDATLGGGEISVEGELTTESGMIGTDLAFDAVRIDARHIGEMLGDDRVPRGDVNAAGRITVMPGGYRLQDVDAELAGVTLAVDGWVAESEPMAGSRLDVRASGPDASVFDPFVAPRSLRAEPFSVSGTIELDRNAVRLLGVDVGLAGASTELEGVVGIGESAEIQITLDARGPSLAVIDTLVPEIGLPPAPFAASGTVSLRNHALRLDTVTFELSDARAEISGDVVLGGQWIGSKARMSVSGGNLGELGRHLAHGFEWHLPELPDETFAAAGEIAVVPTGVRLSGLELALGASAATVNGIVATTPDLFGTNLELRADGPESAPIATILGLNLPNEPFFLDGSAGRDASGIHFNDLSIRFGELRADLDGVLGPLPRLVGTDLSLDVSGPDLSLLRSLFGFESLPPRPFQASGRFSGNPSRFNGESLDIRVGSSDVSGTVTVELASKPTVLAQLTSRKIDIADLVAERDLPTGSNETSSRVIGDRVLSDEPWDLSLLDRADGSLQWAVAELAFRLNTYHDLQLTANLDDSRLEVTTIRGTGSGGGVLHGTGVLSPSGEGYRVNGRLSLDNARINLGAPDADPSRHTEVDVSLDLDVTGASPHELMANADGRFVLSATGGVVRESILDVLYADVLVTILKALNPFARATATNLDCAVLNATFADGVMSLDPAVIQTNAVTVLGNGTVDFSTEMLTLDWVTKPRKGLGLSASAVTNSYIRLGGTLADPNLEVKPLEAAATTGVAVATMGISLVAKGLWDRVTAEKKVCQRAARETEEMARTGGGR